MQTIANDLTEVIFEELNASTALRLAEELIGKSVELPEPEQGVADFRISRLPIGQNVALNKVHVRILRYDDKFDLEVNFVPRDAEGGMPEGLLMDILHDYATKMSQRFGVESYYAGLEPASDLETRFFTGRTRGPY